MLSLLHIENIAVIESADIQFDSGFNALTGETGAGKSIVVDAIGAITGERTSRELIRTGAKSAQVSALFTGLPDLDWFRENGMGPDEDGNLLLQREIQPDGKNVCRLGGRPITVAQLRQLGRQLLNIHGQHDGQQLLDERCHLDYLDGFGGTAPLQARFREAYDKLSAIHKEMAALRMDEAEKARRIDSLEFQINELERAELKAGDEDGNLLLQREIQPDGKNVCRLGGRPITVAQLRQLGRQLLNIHGQHDGQQLLDERCHLDYLDGFGGTAPLQARFREAYDKLSAIHKEMAALRMDEAEKARRIDSLEFQINELERAELKAGEEEALTERRSLLRNAGKLIEAVEGAHRALSGDEEREGAAGLIGQAEGALHAAARLSGQAAALAERLAELSALADDVSEQVRELRDSLDFEPGELDELESRLDVLHRLKKKYGSTVEDMLSYLERCKKELDEIQFADDTIARLEKEQAKALAEAKKRGEALSQARQKAARALEGRIQDELAQLDMPKVRFRTEFSPKAGEYAMDETGIDEVQFLMSANVGEDLKPIQKIASGGELARIMLALKNVLAENDQVGTLVFDEVDTGVSGRAAQKVAEKLAGVAHTKQVLCVTHLPQLAAMADVHFSVEKGEKNGRTFTRVERLSRERRMEELARLTSGDHITDATRRAAGELLDSAEQFKKKGK